MQLVQEGRVAVNGMKILEPSTPIDPAKDAISVDGKRIQVISYEYIVFNKPAGYVTTKAQFPGEKTVFDILPVKYKHLSPVGRLDKDTEGLLLLTNDGDAAYRLTHPKFNVDKTYLARIRGDLKPAEKIKLEKGVVLEGRLTAPAKIKDIRTQNRQTEFLITIHEGRKRHIRLMLEIVGHHVVYLKRLAQGPLCLGALPVGAWRALTMVEIGFLRCNVYGRLYNQPACLTGR